MILMRSLKYSIGGFFIGGFLYSLVSDMKRKLLDVLTGSPYDDRIIVNHFYNFNYYLNYGGLYGLSIGYLISKGYFKSLCDSKQK
tara:strand:+ start:4487 stop:4741 length:255 start_codon:yes stop_codon:yes gene_type:complete